MRYRFPGEVPYLLSVFVTKARALTVFPMNRLPAILKCSAIPNTWDRIQPQDVMSRHRGAKLPRRYELLGGISLLSPEYLLSVERWPFHTEPPDHYVLLSYLLDLSVSQLSTLMPLHY